MHLSRRLWSPIPRWCPRCHSLSAEASAPASSLSALLLQQLPSRPQASRYSQALYSSSSSSSASSSSPSANPSAARLATAEPPAPLSGSALSSRSSRPVPKPIRLQAVSPRLTVPDYIPHPLYALPSGLFSDPRQPRHRSIEVKSAASIGAMRRSCRYAGYIRHFASTLLQPGVTTDAVDRAVHAECVRLGIYPSPLLYAGFPKSLCTSVNQVVCHGIPDARQLEDGDIVNVDVSCYVDGHHGDCSGTWAVGRADAQAHRLIAAVREAVQAAIAVCRPGQPFTAIGAACEAVADRAEYSVVREFCGHGIGRDFHMPPFVFHHRHEGDGDTMRPGMTFTVEPMLNEGGREVLVREDGWTVETRDGMRSAQWEETLLITEEGVEVLTAWDGQTPPVMQHQK